MEIISYSVQEDATPRDPSNFSGGFGQLSYTTLSHANDKRRISTPTSVTDTEKGTFSGIIQRIESSDQTVTITANSVLSEFNGFFSLPPFQGTLQNYVQSLMQICGVVAPLAVDPTLSGRNVEVPGFEGNVWDRLRQFASIQQFDIAQVADRIVVRPLRSIEAYTNRDITEGYSISSETTTEKLRVFWYDGHYGTNQEINLQGLEQNTPITVDAGSVVIQEFTIDGSLSSVNQPIVRDYVAAESTWDGTSGAYCVAGNDGKPITAAQWTAQGGSVSVRVTDDPSVIEVTVVAPTDETYAPYRIAATAGTSSFYSSLRITGTGFSWEQKSIEIHTGAPRDPTAKETTQEFDYTLVTSLASAYSVALRMSSALCGGVQTVSGTSFSLNRPSDRHGDVSASFRDFDNWASQTNITTLGGFDSWASSSAISSFQDFDDFWEGYNSDLLVNQAFGQVVGARLRRPDSWFRVQSTTTTPENVQYTLEADTTMEDWNEFAQDHNIRTFADFDSWYDRYRFVDFDNTCLQEKVTD